MSRPKVFEAFLERVLLRKLHPGDIVVLDKRRRPPYAERPSPCREEAGATVLYLPPYSPDLNPIELAWSKLKAIFKDFGARTHEALDAAILRTMDLIGRSDAAGWFQHCGYQAHAN